MFATTLTVSSYEPFAAMAPHAHQDASLSIVTQGGYVERVAGSERRYARDTIVFCPAGLTHSQVFGAEGARQILVTPQACWLDYLVECKLSLGHAPYAAGPVFRQLSNRLLAELPDDDAFAALAREGILLEIVAAFGRQSDAAPAEPPAWLRAARDFLDAHAFTPLVMADVARAAGRHEIHVAREFRRHYHMSIGLYQRQLRTEHAARMLRLPQRVSISEIALSCGFASHAHLCREFKKQLGVTPSQYRAARR